ncbi:MAG: type II secretion system F family protein, partial [Campylobacterota bacterium]|nr:type II secretion system F family protein [Campylobacterota bacterium]
MLFKYSGYDKSGKKVNGKIEADSLKSAKAQIKYKNIFLNNIQEETNFLIGNFSLKRRTKLKPLVLSTISRDLGIYLHAGISLLNAMKLINERYKKDKVLNPFFVSVITHLDEGKNLYTSLEMQKIVELPEFYLQSIKISEDGGILESILEELADYLKEQDNLNKQVSSAMAYPSFIIIVSFLMVGFMLSFIVPKITAIFDQTDQALPGITQFVVSSGDFVNNYYAFILVSFVMLISLFTFSMKKYPTFKYKVDTILLKIPFIGRLIEIGELSRFAYMNSILIKSGVPVVQSFKLGSNILKNSVIKKLFSTASDKVVEGEKLSKILDTSEIYKIDIAFIQAVAIGEETSELSKILQNLAQLYTAQNKDKIGIFLTLLEPMFMLIVGSIIGFIVVAMLLPIFSMSLG